MSGTTVTYDNATYATQSYVTTQISNLVNGAPGALDTLNELAAAKIKINAERVKASSNVLSKRCEVTGPPTLIPTKKSGRLT